MYDASKVRRFEMGASGLNFVDYLKQRGYDVQGIHNGQKYKVRKPGASGRPKSMTKTAVLQMVDDLRKKAGLQPIYRK